MKKTGLLIITIAIALIAKAQPDVTSAFNANKAGKFEDAVMYIEKAASDPKATSKEKYWRYRGNIYLNVARDQALSAKYPTALTTALESYRKGMELDTHGDYKGEVQVSMADLQTIALERAEQQYTAKDFCGAAEHFVIARSVSEQFAIVDSAAIFNAAFCYDKCGTVDKAIEGYKRCGEIGYNVPDVYMYSSDLLLKQGRKEEALQVLSDARAKYPKDANLLRTEVNIYLNDNAYDKAETVLKSLTETDPNNETIWFVLGVTYEKLGKKAEQEEAYKSALKVKPDYYDALFNLGAMYFNDGLENEKLCNEIPPREKAKYDDCVAKSKASFVKSVEQLEKAYRLNSSEKEIIAALKDAYYKAERMEDYERMKALLK